jgi:hypothetical protein
MTINGDVREWLEQQSKFFERQIQSAKDKRHRAYKAIRRKADTMRQYNHKLTEYKKLKAGIDKMLEEENWTL